ncbi:hypothetical protein [Vibrio cholerae]|uniref:hypothetical protein n=1 Tax=Vibrio cholerae TaxID=666 RepID=UPI00115A3C53|nr:hypothetical protein [Vibrio cholerae]TQQ57681.1 hypothetical protein FLL61_15895 [Vibrio cholerae]
MTDTVSSTPVADTTPYEIFLSGNDDFLIPVVFPDYLISVADEQSFELWGVKIKTPAVKAPYLGHAGVILINGETGVTRYYEYGRYKNPKSDIPGNVRKVGVSNVTIKSGLITESSLLKVLKEVSLRSGQEGRISGVVLRGKFFSEADSWLRGKMDLNNSPDKIPYDLDSHNCMTFVIDLADAMGLDPAWKPPVVVPSAYIEQFQLSEIDLDYNFKTNKLTVSE